MQKLYANGDGRTCIECGRDCRMNSLRVAAYPPWMALQLPLDSVELPTFYHG
jgi:hypothetical protein